MSDLDDRFFTRRYLSRERVMTKALPWSDERCYIELPPVLRVFEMLSGPDTVVAFDKDDAWDVWEKYCGESRSDYEDDDGWVEVPATRLLTIWLDEDYSNCDCRQRQQSRTAETRAAVALIDKLPGPARGSLWAGVPKPLPAHPNGHLLTCPVGSRKLPAAAWARDNGRGFLCSTEY